MRKPDFDQAEACTDQARPARAGSCPQLVWLGEGSVQADRVQPLARFHHATSFQACAGCYAARMRTSSAVAIYCVDPGRTTGCGTILANLSLPTVAQVIRRARAKGHILTWNERGTFTEQSWHISRDILDFFFSVHIERGLVAADSMYIVVEDFHLRIMSADLSPIWITAGIEVLLSNALNASWELDGFYSKQNPSEAKGFCSDDMLKRWGLWRGHTTHERDVIRHMARKIDKLLQEV